MQAEMSNVALINARRARYSMLRLQKSDVQYLEIKTYRRHTPYSLCKYVILASQFAPVVFASLALTKSPGAFVGTPSAECIAVVK